MSVRKPMRLLPASAWRTYRGGSLLAALHGQKANDSHFPEEWLLSTVRARNAGREDIVEGLSLIESDGSLKDYLAVDPEGLLGPGRHETGMLMKLIDSAERLSVQVHPTRADAMRLFGSPYGKTECWHILGGREIGGRKPCIWFGFKPGVTREAWARLFYAQDIPGMLDCLHRIEVQPGETWLICGGVPHAIGPGCFLAEIQEPTDLTLRTERTDPQGNPLPDESCHQGIGFERMLDCFRYEGRTLKETRAAWRITPRRIGEGAGYERISLLGYDSTPYFRLEKWTVSGAMRCDPQSQYWGLYALAGEGSLTVDGEVMPVRPGDQGDAGGHAVMVILDVFRLDRGGDDPADLRMVHRLVVQSKAGRPGQEGCQGVQLFKAGQNIRERHGF